ncbi:MAG: hypothetical protein C0594_12075 [Marinilabiliales bacterium]|nr:MAG: hypothetical protein C0594_12075 [Marinilabiliales bacterium]
MDFKVLLLCIIGIAVIANSCGLSLSNKVTEGIIEYDLTYPDDDNPIVGLLPNTMILQFSDDKIAQKVESCFGMFKMGGIYDSNNASSVAYLKVLADKYLCVNEASFGYDEYPDMQIKYIDEEKEIVGYKCKRADITVPGGRIETFSVWYTDEIELVNANFFNPFKDIPGVLLEFQYEMFDITTSLKATKVEYVEVNNETFATPSDFKRVSKEEMEEFIHQNLIEPFNPDSSKTVKQATS